MSTLSQFVPAGDSYLGETAFFYSNTVPFNYTTGTREYLRSGYMKAYDSGYAPLASAVPLLVANTPTDPVHEDYVISNDQQNFWSYHGRNMWFKMFEQGFASGSGLSYKHIIRLGYSSISGYHHHVWGENLASARTGQDGVGWSGIYSADQFNSRIIIAGAFNFPDDAGTGVSVGWTTTTSQGFTTTYLAQATYQEGIWSCDNAANSQLWLHDANSNSSSTNGLYYTSNGTAITKRTPPVDMRYTRLRTWSRTGSRFVLIRENGTLLTTVDGSTVTTVAAGSITGANSGKLPKAVGAGVEYGAPRCVDHATNGTLMVLGPYNKSLTNGIDQNCFLVLRTTNGTSFTIEDLLPTNPNLQVFFGPPAAGTAGARYTPYVYFDGTRIWMWNWTIGVDPVVFWSSDWGATWNGPDYFIFNNNGGLERQNFGGLYQFGGVLYGLMSAINGGYMGHGNAKVYDFTGRRMRSTPQFVGTNTGLTFASGSSLSVYNRIK